MSLRLVDDDNDGLVGGGVSLHDHPEGVDHTRTPKALGQHDWDLKKWTQVTSTEERPKYDQHK